MEQPGFEDLQKTVGQETAEAILQRGVDFEVTVLHQNILHKKGLKKDSRKFKIYPICFGALLKISELLEKVRGDHKELDQADGGEFFGTALKSIIENKDLMISIIAIAIVNKEKDPPKSLIKFLNANLDTKEACALLNLVIQQMDMQRFLVFMVSVGSLNLLKTSPTTGESSEELLNTSDSQESKSSGSTVGQI